MSRLVKISVLLLLVFFYVNSVFAGSYLEAWDLSLPVPGYDPLWKKVDRQWRDHFDKKSVDEMIAILEALKKKHPDKIEPYLWLGKAYYLKGKYDRKDRVGNFEKSEKNIVKALDFDKKNIKAVKILSAALASYKTFDEISAQYMTEAEKNRFAVPVGRALPELKPSDTWKKAIGYWDKREDVDSAEKAVALFKKIAEKEPENALAKTWVTRGLYYIGYYYTSIDQHEKGLPFYHEGNKWGLEALKLDPFNVPANYWRQLCVSRSIEEASMITKARNLKTIMDHLVFTANENPTYFYNGPVLSISTIILKGGWVAEKGMEMAGYDMKAVIAGVNMGLLAYPTYMYSYYAKAHVLFHLGEKEQAKKLIQEMLKIDPYVNKYHAPENINCQRLARRFLANME